MQPASIIPPFSTTTHQTLSLHVTEKGLVLHPHSAPSSAPATATPEYQGSAVLIEWGRDGAVRELTAWKDDPEQDGEGLILKGIAGLLRLHEDSYLLLIIDTVCCATLFTPNKSISTVSSLLAIPLAFTPAKALLNKAVLKQRTKALADKNIPRTKLKRGNSAGSIGGISSTGTETETSETEAFTSDGGSDDDDDETEDEASGMTDREADNDPIPVLIHAEDEDRGKTIRKPPTKGGFWKRTPNYSPQQPSPLRSLASIASLASTKTVTPPAAKVPSFPETQVVSVATLPLPPTTTLATISGTHSTIITPPSASTSPSTTTTTITPSQSLLELDQKIVKETLREITGLYFSHQIDITRSVQHKYELLKDEAGGAMGDDVFREPHANLPVWRRADRRFWWNRHLIREFVEAGLHSYVLVLQQGFAEHLKLSLPSQSPPPPLPPSPTSSPTHSPPSSAPPIPLELLIISRRSTDRPGLRYQRRGINVEGQVANMVETEFIVCCRPGGEGTELHVGSWVQSRGSIPLFWSQAPWALKPPPVLERTPEESRTAMKKHFERQKELYGNQVIVNLAEGTGRESVVVSAYKDGVESLKEGGMEGVKYTEWDFHKECRGMKYENISKLIKTLTPDLEDQSYFWATSREVYSTQTSIVRTNCIDCLDRTNVVQSAIARWILDGHLVRLGIPVDKDKDKTESVATGGGVLDELDSAFMNAWADNGDAISREYSGTSALKGDFTRTGKRNWRGAVNDASNSVARLLQSTVTDFFKQAVIDFVLGKNPSAFIEFQQRLDTSDPGELLRLAQIRKEAIETAAGAVISEGEERLDGWTLLSPGDQDVVKGKFEEKILLLSSSAVYVVSYEYTLQKVVSFTRIPTGDIVGIQKGAYILAAPLDATSRSADENYGFLLRYHPTSTIERTNTYSLRSASSPRRTSSKSLAASISSQENASPQALEVHFFAFKAMRPEMIRLASDGYSQILDMRKEGLKGKTARDVVEGIIAHLREEGEKVGATEGSDDGWVVEKDIIGLLEAKRQVGLIDKLSHSLKELIWA